MMCDFGTGNNNKLNWVLEDKQELIDIIETIYRGAKKGRGLVVSPKGGSGLLDTGYSLILVQTTRPDIVTRSGSQQLVCLDQGVFACEFHLWQNGRCRFSMVGNLEQTGWSHTMNTT